MAHDSDASFQSPAIVETPGERSRSEGALDVALVGVDVRSQHQGELGPVAELTGEEVLEDGREPLRTASGEDRPVVIVAKREVDVAGVPLGLVELRHERERHPFLGSDLLGAGLVDDMVVGGPERLVVAEGDLVLPEVALTLRRLHHHARRSHLVADTPQQRLDPTGPEDRVVDVVAVCRGVQ
jgi:hypothetical protein